MTRAYRGVGRGKTLLANFDLFHLFRAAFSKLTGVYS
jgi:hypothetical protein